MFGWGKKKTETHEDLIAPVAGTLIDIASVPDPLFSSGQMGPGFAVEPTGTTVCAPVDGELMLVADTGHAFAVKTAQGCEVLVHIGVDTVALKGTGFSVHPGRAAGVAVKAGDPIVDIDLATLAEGAPSSAVIVLVTNVSKGFAVSGPALDASFGEPVVTVTGA